MSSANNAFYTKLHYSTLGNKCLILEENSIRTFKGFVTPKRDELKIMKKPAISDPSSSPCKTDDSSEIFEIFAKELNVIQSYVDTVCGIKEFVEPFTLKRTITDDLDIQRIVDGGDPTNRLDVVFMGDGYTLTEREQFFADIRRLTNDMFNGDTFRSYLPLFNIWAVFVPSNVSGIGYNGPKDTPFRLYRDKGQLRAINTDNAPFARQVCI